MGKIFRAPSFEEVSRINIKLKETYGLEGIKPRFQLVWSETQEEVRKGEFNRFSESGLIFLGTESGVHKRQKYAHVKERWVLEGLIYDPQPEYPDSNQGHYEPLWVFEANGEYRRPEWPFVNYVVLRVLELRTGKLKRTEMDDWEDDKAAYEKEVTAFEDQLDSSVMQTQLHHGEAISMSGIKK